jgi:hypothetical protein
MANEYADTVHLILALKGARSEIWAAATARGEAVRSVQVMLGKGWEAVRIVETRLTPERIASLKLSLDGVRKLSNAA